MTVAGGQDGHRPHRARCWTPSPRSTADTAGPVTAHATCTATRRRTSRPSGPRSRRRGITVRIARKGVESHQRLGRHRWIVEACLSWLLNNRRLVRRYERKGEHFQAFADLAAALLSYRRWTTATTRDSPLIRWRGRTDRHYRHAVIQKAPTGTYARSVKDRPLYTS